MIIVKRSSFSSIGSWTAAEQRWPIVVTRPVPSRPVPSRPVPSRPYLPQTQRTEVSFLWPRSFAGVSELAVSAIPPSALTVGPQSLLSYDRREPGACVAVSAQSLRCPVYTLPVGRRPSTIDHRPSTVDRRPSTIDHRSSTVDRRPSTIVSIQAQLI
uniref:Uncharacterized protein n=1 Tax=Anopheles atroparvus TaxID=41427 RepID=A0A182J7D2_ANOAO